MAKQIYDSRKGVKQERCNGKKKKQEKKITKKRTNNHASEKEINQTQKSMHASRLAQTCECAI